MQVLKLAEISLLLSEKEKKKGDEKGKKKMRKGRGWKTIQTHRFWVLYL